MEALRPSIKKLRATADFLFFIKTNNGNMKNKREVNKKGRECILNLLSISYL